MKPLLLDLFCGAGGCAMGYSRAGFDIVGVDIKPRPRYPFEFIQADALEYLAREIKESTRWYDAIHASPPCQAYSTCTPISRRTAYVEHADLVGPTRELLDASGKLFVIENVRTAPMTRAIMLCGSMFGLDVRRHRLFESNLVLLAPSCNHSAQRPRFRSLDSRRGQLAAVVGVHGSLNYSGERQIREKAMGIDWMTVKELSQAIPPAYTEYIGKQLIGAL